MTRRPEGACIIVAMGVAGSGKSTLAARVADVLACEFAEGDDLHPPENIAKMAAGRPLDDSDREPWLQAVALWITSHDTAGTGGVISCSALKSEYRDRLRAASARTRFVCLSADRQVLIARLYSRQDHFMKTSMLESQLAIFEPLAADELGCTLEVGSSMDDIALIALEHIRRWTFQLQGQSAP
jgi:gluconokinase